MRTYIIVGLGLLIGFGAAWAGDPGATENGDANLDSTRAVFRGKPGKPYHVVYVVDCSGSMLGSFDLVRSTVHNSIAILHENQQFRVISFGGQSFEPETQQLVRASIENKIKAAEFIRDVQPQGASDPIPALERAFKALSQASREAGKIVYLITDGDFSDSEKVLATIRSLNEKKDVVIVTVQCGRRSSDAQKVLKAIAQENDGKYTLVGLGQAGDAKASSQPASAPSKVEAFLALVKQAVQKKPEERGFMGGQRSTGLDFGPILASTGQYKALASFPEERGKQEEAISALAKERKAWALAALLNHGDVDVKIRSARALVELADPRTVPALLATAKANNYPVPGSESATLHSIYRRTLKEGLEKITGLKLTPVGLRITEYPKPGEPRVITSDDRPERFPEDVDFVKVAAWLSEKYLADAQTQAAPPEPATQPSADNGRWSATVEGLRMRLVAPDGQVTVNKDFELRMLIQNLSDKPISTRQPFFLSVIRDPVEHPGGKHEADWSSSVITARWPHRLKHGWNWHSDSRTEMVVTSVLQPGATRTVLVRVAGPGQAAEALSKGAPQTETMHFLYHSLPGTYLLTATYAVPPGTPNVWTGTLVAPSVAVELVPSSATRPSTTPPPQPSTRYSTKPDILNPPSELPRRGTHEGSPALSHDGRTLAWFHREDEKAFLCVVTSPWGKAPQKIEVRNSAVRNYIDPVQLSGDGHHAFVNGQYVEILEGVPVLRGVLPGKISYFGVAPSFDGSKVAAPIDGKDGELRLLSRDGNRYVEGGILIPGRNGQPVRGPLINGDGNLVVAALGDSLHEAVFDGDTWKEGAVAFDLKIETTPLAMSADGRTLLLQGFKHDHGRTAENIYLSSRDVRNRWQQPKLLLNNAGHTVYNCSMSPDAKTIVWVHYTRDDKGSITRTELQFMRRQEDGWTEASTILDKDGYVQFMSIALSNNDVLAYALADRSKPPGSCTVFLRPDLKPETRAININERVEPKH